MPTRFIRIGGKEMLWGLGIVVAIPALLIVVVLAINATDVPLSDAAQSAMRVPPPPPPSERNGYVDSLGLAAPDGMSAYEAGLKVLSAGPKGEAWKRRSVGEQMPSCWREEFACIHLSSAGSVLRTLFEAERVFLDRYRAMQAKPEFADLWPGADSPDDPIPGYQDFLVGLRLTLVEAALRFNAGDRAGAIDIVEREKAFFRRVATGSRSLIQKLIAFAAISRAELFAAELARRLPVGDKALWQKLERVVQPLSAVELDVTGALRFEHAQGVKFRQTRRFVRHSDATYESFAAFGLPSARPWWDALWPYLYRPHYNTNHYVARTDLLLRAGDVPASDFLRTVDALAVQAEALLPAEWARWFINPIGWGHYNLGSRVDETDYFGRAHGLAAMQTLVRLQVRLRAEGARDPDLVRRAIAGPLGKALSNPFDGRPAMFDEASGTIGFEVPERFLPAGVRFSTGAAWAAGGKVWLKL